MQNIKITNTRIRPTKKTEEEYEKLKKSIKTLGLSNPIIVTHELELIDGYHRLKIFKELHDQDSENQEFFDIPTLVVLVKEEIEALVADFRDGRSTDYMRDTACDRLNNIYNNSRIPLNETLGINEQELKNRIMVGEALRNGILSKNDDFISKYKKGMYSHREVVLRLEEKLPAKTKEVVKEENIVEEKTFNINDWI